MINKLLTIAVLLSIFPTSCKLFCPEEEESIIEPQTQRIAFLRDRDPNNGINTDTDIWIMDMDGSNQTQLTYNIDGINDFIFSPDGKKICFRVGYSYTDSDLFIMYSDGTELINLTNDNKYYYLPIFTPDSEELIYMTETNNDIPLTNIFKMNINGYNKTNITNSDSLVEKVCGIKPDGSQILISSVPPGQPGLKELYFIDLDGINKTCINCQDPNFYSHLQQISKDGNTIYFIGNNRYAGEVLWEDGSEYVSQLNSMNIDGSSIKNIWGGPALGYYTELLLAHNDEFIILKHIFSNFSCYKINTNGSGYINLTETKDIYSITDISFDSKYLAFTQLVNNQSEVFICNNMGDEQKQLTILGGKYPKFQPIQ